MNEKDSIKEYYNIETNENLVKVGTYYISKSQYERTLSLMAKFNDYTINSLKSNILNNIESYSITSEYLVNSR